jgi:hypothetical protein
MVWLGLAWLGLAWLGLAWLGLNLISNLGQPLIASSILPNFNVVRCVL